MEQEEIRIRVYAKINTALFVAPRSDGGYHDLDTVMASVSLCDEITVRKSAGTAVYLDGQRADSSNAHKAALALQALGAGGMEVHVQRHIPSGCGVGGSSADAAGVLRAGATLFSLPVDDAFIHAALRIGSDVPYMLRGGFARVRGRGERIERMQTACVFPLLLVKKGQVSTRECFSAFDRLPPVKVGSADIMAAALSAGNTSAVANRLHNDLTAAAVSLNPFIGRALDIFAAHGLRACMTGSGAGVFALGSPDALESVEEVFEDEGYETYPLTTVTEGISIKE